MSENPLKKLNTLGQSVWLDYLSREVMNSGKLRRLIDEDGLSGVTSNPTIFQKAISGSSDYDDSLRALLDKGVRDEKELFLGIAFEDIARAADIMWPVYESTGGNDGFISLEVSPDLAYNTEATIEEAKRLFSEINKKNIMIKVPATREGLPAIEHLTREGVNVNVTLLFSVKRYEEVAESYLNGLEKRLSQGNPVNEIHSVASFFVSRVDTLTDRLLEEKVSLAKSEKEKGEIRSLLGKAAVANAKCAYKKFEDIFLCGRFPSLKEKGARLQRLLWGSTGTKNPNYSDVMYVEEIIAHSTVNTLPEATINAFRDHGKAAITINDEVDEAEALFDRLASFGIDIDQVTEQLEKEGVRLFSDSFFALLGEIGEKRDTFLAGKS